MLQHAELVEVVPALDYFTVGETEEAHPRYIYPFACGGDAPELARVGSFQPPAVQHLVPFPDHVLDDVLGVGEGGVNAANRRTPTRWGSLTLRSR